MPSISNPRKIDTAPESLSWTERGYRSPDGVWRAVLHSPDEFHMMATGWALKLFERGRRITRQHPFLLKHAGRRAIDPSPDMAPWSFDSRTLVLITWASGTPVMLYDVLDRTGLFADLPDSPNRPTSAQCDPAGPYAAILYPSNLTLLEPRGVRAGVVEWPRQTNDRPSSFWLPAGNLVCVLRRVDGIVHAQFFSSTGSLVDDLPLDPLVLVPYDAERYAAVDRSHFTLVVNRSIKAVGLLLDTWQGVRFDHGTGTLQLTVYRPQGEPYQDTGQTVCRVTEVRMAVDVRS